MKWLKILLGCGCLTALVLGSLAFYAYKKVSQSVMMDPARVLALATSMAPGVENPAGYQGFLGLDTSVIQMAMLGPKDAQGKLGENGMLLAVVALPEDAATKAKTRDQWEAEMKKSVAEQSKDKDTQPDKLISEEQITLQIGSVQVPAERATLEKPDKSREVHMIAMARHATQARIVGFVIEAPEKDFSDQLVQTFLGKAQVRALFEAAPDAATPPAEVETPEASETPEATVSPEDDGE